MSTTIHFKDVTDVEDPNLLYYDDYVFYFTARCKYPGKIARVVGHYGDGNPETIRHFNVTDLDEESWNDLNPVIEVMEFCKICGCNYFGEEHNCEPNPKRTGTTIDMRAVVDLSEFK